MTGVEFCELASALGYDFFTGVPDSTLKSVFKELEDNPRYFYLPSVREDNAVGLAVGAFLGGRSPIVFMQNSGLGHCINALTSLVSLYRIPLLLVIGWRGVEDDDAVEHLLMGSASPALLTAVSIPFWSPLQNDVSSALRSASLNSRSASLPAALLMREKVFD